MNPAPRKTLRILLKSLLGLLGILFLAALLLLWRLSSGPIELNQFIPRIEQAASNIPGGLSVRLEGLGLFWNRAERQVDLKGLSVDLVDASGVNVVSVPEVKVSLSLRALLRGVLALRSIALQGIDVQLVRLEDGSFQVFETSPGAMPGSANKPQRDYTQIARQIFKVLTSEPDSTVPLSFLKELKFMGTLDIDDRKEGVHWTMDTVESLFRGKQGKVEGSLGISFSSPPAMQGVHANIAMAIEHDDVIASLQFENIRPADLALLDQSLAPLSGLATSISGNIDTTFTLPGRIHSLTADIKAGAGRLSYKDFFPEPLGFDSLEAQLSADLPGRSLEVSSLDIAFAGTAPALQLHLQGSAQQQAGAFAFSLEAVLQRLNVQSFNRYWPAGIAEGARDWLVANMKAGTVGQAQLDLAMVVPAGSANKLQVKKLEGSLDYENLTVAYFGSLPPATGVTGKGTFDRHGFDLEIGKGQVNGISIESGKVIISGLDDNKAALSVNTHLDGPLAATFAVLEAPPIELGKGAKEGPVSKRLGGQVEADFAIALPLKSGLEAGDVKFRANGNTRDGRLGKAYRDYDLQAASLEFELDQSSLKISGPMALSGVPFTLVWTSSLDGPDKGHADFSIDAPTITAAQIDGLGFDVSGFLRGSVALKSNAVMEPGGAITTSVEIDMKSAGLSIPGMAWKKPLGEAGDIGFSLRVEKDHLHARDIDITLGELKTKGNAEFDLAGDVMGLTLEHLSLSDAQLDGLKLERSGAGNLRFTLQGGEVNLEPFLSGGARARDAHEKAAVEDSALVAGRMHAWGLKLEVGDSKLDKVYLGKDTWLDDVSFSADWESGGFQQLSLSGHNPSAANAAAGSAGPAKPDSFAHDRFALAYGPPDAGRYALHVKVGDLGALVSAVIGSEVMSGGYLVLDGDSQGPLLAKPIRSTFELGRFTVKKAPIMTQLLNMASLTQMIATLRQTGLAFNSASGDLSLQGARLASQQINVKGGSLGLLAGGWVDLEQKNVDISGTVVPMQKLTAIVGKVPVLGQMVTGRDGMGIMAVNYTVKGPYAKSVVAISKAPLTPGIFKSLLLPEADQTGKDPR